MTNIWNGAVFVDIDCPLIASRSFVGISWASCFSCERLFSVAGHILNKKRASLSSSNLNKLLCLHSRLNE